MSLNLCTMISYFVRCRRHTDLVIFYITVNSSWNICITTTDLVRFRCQAGFVGLDIAVNFDGIDRVATIWIDPEHSWNVKERKLENNNHNSLLSIGNLLDTCTHERCDTSNMASAVLDKQCASRNLQEVNR